MREKFDFQAAPTAFGEPGAKRSQDDKPCNHAEPVRTTSVDHGLWSHLSLRSRRGMELSATWPQLAELTSAQSIPARPFGLGLRFDGAHPVTLVPSLTHSRAARIKPSRENERSLAYIGDGCKSTPSTAGGR